MPRLFVLRPPSLPDAIEYMMRWANCLAVHLLILLWLVIAPVSAQRKPAKSSWSCNDCPDEIAPVCINGVTFRHRCLAECQGQYQGTEGACSDDRWFRKEASGAATVTTAASAVATTKSASEQATVAALQTAGAIKTSKRAAAAPSPSPSTQARRKPRVSDMEKFSSHGFLYVGSLALRNGPAADWDPSTLQDKIQASAVDYSSSSARTAAAAAETSLDDLQVRGIRYSPDNGDFYVEASARPVHSRGGNRALLADILEGSGMTDGSHHGGSAGAAAAGIGGRRQLLGDNRWRVTDGTVYPYSAVSYITYLQPVTARGYQCSAVFISPWDVLTAAHCVWDFFNSTGYTSWRIYPGLGTNAAVNSNTPYISADYVTFYRTERTNKSYADQRNAVNYFDIAVIRVRSQYTAWLGIKYDCGRVTYPKTMACGYSDGINWAQCSQCYLTSSQCRPMWQMYNYCYSRKGQSGMAITDLNDTRVLGVLSGGPSDNWDYSYWTPIDAFHFTNLVRWMWPNNPAPVARPPSPPPSLSPAVIGFLFSPPPIKVSRVPNPKLIPPLSPRPPTPQPPLPLPRPPVSRPPSPRPPSPRPPVSRPPSPAPPRKARLLADTFEPFSPPYTPATASPSPQSPLASPALDVSERNLELDIGSESDVFDVVTRSDPVDAADGSIGAGNEPPLPPPLSVGPAIPAAPPVPETTGADDGTGSGDSGSRSSAGGTDVGSSSSSSDPGDTDTSYSPPDGSNLDVTARGSSPSTGGSTGSSTASSSSTSTLMGTECKHGQVRLADGPNAWSGRLEFCKAGRWGTICDSGWGWDDARVACRQLGYPAGGEAILGGWFPNASASTPIHYGNVSCLGSEVGLGDCTLPVPPDSCSHKNDAGLICSNAAVASPPPASGSTNGSNTFQPGDYGCDLEGQLRLVSSLGTVIMSNPARTASGVAPARGRLEVCSGGQWGSVCDDNWDNNDALVACKQFGYTSGLALSQQMSTPGIISWGVAALAAGPLNMSIWLSGVACSGSETSLMTCRRSAPLGRAACTHQEDAGVVCSMSYPANAPAPPSPPQPPPPECSEDGALRLVPLQGQPSGVGRLEVCYSGRYGVVCDNGFGLLEARVACRQLGYTYGRPLSPANSSVAGDPGAGAIVWMDNVRCTMFSSDAGNVFWRLTQCLYSGWGGSTCDPRRQAVGIMCSNDAAIIAPSPPRPPPSPYACSTPGSVRLMGGTSPGSGRVEVCSNDGMWGTICNNGWGNTDAAVACSSLGYSTGVVAVNGSFSQAQSDQLMLLSELTCNGTEGQLSACGSVSAALSAGCTDHRRDAGVVCSNLSPPPNSAGYRAPPPRQNFTCSTEGAIRIVGSPNTLQTGTPAVGRVDICHNGQWGAICNRYDDPSFTWDDITATVVCRQFSNRANPPDSMALDASFAGVPVLPVGMKYWRYNVVCDGDEWALGTCQGGWTAPDSCGPTDVVGVRCP